MTAAAIAPPPAIGTFALTADQVVQFHRDGFLGPLTVCSPQEMAPIREHIERVVASPGIGGCHSGHNRHLDDRPIYDLVTRPQIIEAMASVLGKDLLLWRTNFFIKEPGSKEIPWHQDRNYWPLEPEIVISAWLAIDPATVENSCVQVVPGTHRKVIGHVKAGPEMQFVEQADTARVDLSKKIDMELQPGQYMLFNERTLHHSEPNRSTKRRMGLAIRVIIPQVRVLEFDSPQHKLMVVSGRDPLGFNELCDPPLE